MKVKGKGKGKRKKETEIARTDNFQERGRGSFNLQVIDRANRVSDLGYRDRER